MSAPNIINIASIVGKTQIIVLSANSAAPTTIISASANTLVKVNSITIINSGAFSSDISLNFVRNANTFPLASGINVPEKSNLVLSGRDTALYLEELDTIQGYSTSANTLYASLSYEIIS